MSEVSRRVAQRYAAVVDQAELDRWVKDLRLMTKIYRSIPVDLEWDALERERDKARGVWDEARQLFRRFRENFEKWVYKVVLPKREKGRETALEGAIRKSVWNFLYTLDGGTFLFPALRPSGDPDYSGLRREREGNIKRYQAAGTKAFKDLTEYLRTESGERYEREDHFEVAGIDVVVENWGRDEGDEREFHFAMNQLSKWVQWIERAGFKGACRGLMVTMNFEGKEALTAGKYSPAQDSLTLYPLGIVGQGDDAGATFVHEMGHRFYFRDLPGQARAHWEEVMEARGVKITDADVQQFYRVILQQDPPVGLWGDEDRLRAVLPRARDLTDEVKFKELARAPVAPWGDKAFDAAEYLKRLSGYVGETVQIEEITDYANTNPMEAYAECFREFVLKGPRALKPWTRAFFGRVSRAGGARLARGPAVDDPASPA